MRSLESSVPLESNRRTCYGLNNTGAYVFEYDCDFKDPATFNGSDSVLWDKLYRLQMPDIMTKYRRMRGTTISYDKIMNVVYDQNIKYKSEAMYNSSAFFRYIIPNLEQMSGTQLPAAQGNRLSLLKYWNKNRQTYLDSRYGADDYSEDRVIMRMYAPKSFDFNITPDTTMYLGLAFNQSDASMPATRSASKVLAGDTWSYHYNIEAPLQDLNTYIYGASHLTDIGDISWCCPKSLSLEKATKLKRLKLGTDDADVLARYDAAIANQGLVITLPINQCKNMREIDLHNLKYLSFGGGTALSLVNGSTNLFPALERVDIRGTNINTITIGMFTPLQYLGLSDLITNINLINLPQLSTVETGNLQYINFITIVNCPKLNQKEILDKFVGRTIAIDIDNLRCDIENSVTMDYMDWLVRNEAKINGGDIYVQSISNENLDVYRTRWPRLTIHLDQIYENDAILGVDGEGANAQLTRTYGATGKANTYAYTDTDAVVNPFDETFLGNGSIAPEYVINVVDDWIRINPFYTSYSTDSFGQITGRKISLYKIDDSYVMNPAFIDANGTIGPVYISAKLYSNTANGAPVSQTPTEWDNLVNTLEASNELYRYSTETIWIRQLLQDLFAIEFATTKSMNAFRGTEAIDRQGKTDDLNYVTGVNIASGASQINRNDLDFKYRGIENLWRGGVPTYIAGATNQLSVLSVDIHGVKHPLTHSLLDNVTSGYLCSLKLHTIYYTTSDGETRMAHLTMPYDLDNNSANIDNYPYSDYVAYNDTKAISYTCTGGANLTSALWSYVFGVGASSQLRGRLVRYYKNNKITE